MSEELLVIQDPKEEKFLKEIKWNREEIIGYVKSVVEQYRGLAYTEAQIKSAKTDRAHLNAMKKSISDRRIQVKKAFMEPYDRFEDEVKEVISLIDEPIQMIDVQIKEYEDKTKEEKRQALEEYYAEEAGNLGGIIPFERVFDRKHLNVSVSLNKAKSEISEKLERVRKELRTIEDVYKDGSYYAVALNTYVRNLDVSAAMADAQAAMELDERMEAEKMRKLEEEEEARQVQSEEIRNETVPEKAASNIVDFPHREQEVPEAERREAEPVAQVPAGGPEENAPVTIENPEKPEPVRTGSPKMCKASFTVYGTKEEIFAVRDFMRENHIRFGKEEE